MSEVVNHEKIYDMVVQSAQKCTEFYKLLSSYIVNEQLKQIYDSICREGKIQNRQVKRLESLLKKIKSSKNFNYQRSVFYYNTISDVKFFEEDDPDDKWGVELKDEISSIQVAISYEKDSILFWEEVKNLYRGKVNVFILDIIKQKKERLNKFLELKKQLSFSKS